MSNIPKVHMTADINLCKTLTDMGMTNAFIDRKADFSGMDGTHELFIDKILHKAYVDINEKGTEAAATTSVCISAGDVWRTARRATFRADHPFIVLIQENQTGSILFMGRVTNPSVAPTSGK
jgi:serpin B